MTVRVRGTGISGPIAATLGPDIIIQTVQFGPKQVPAVLVDVVPGSEDADADQMSIDACLQQWEPEGVGPRPMVPVTRSVNAARSFVASLLGDLPKVTTAEEYEHTSSNLIGAWALLDMHLRHGRVPDAWRPCQCGAFPMARGRGDCPNHPPAS